MELRDRQKSTRKRGSKRGSKRKIKEKPKENGKGRYKLMRSPITVRFRGDKSQLLALIKAKILKPQVTRGNVYFRLSDIEQIAERASELETLLETIRGLVNDDS